MIDLTALNISTATHHMIEQRLPEFPSSNPDELFLDWTEAITGTIEELEEERVSGNRYMEHKDWRYRDYAEETGKLMSLYNYHLMKWTKASA